MKMSKSKGLFLMAPCLMAAPLWAQSQQGHLTQANAKPAKPAVKLNSAGAQLLNGSLGIASKSVEARQQLEMALSRYENAQYAEAIAHAKTATQKDPNFALAYALWSYAAKWIGGAPDALHKAQALEARSAPDEKLLVKFMTGTQEADSVPAIQAMNDLISKHPKDKHVLYLAGEWLFFQQDYVRGRKLMEASLEVDPKFPPALNTLGYAYVESLDPEPAKGISLLRRYCDVMPEDANPQDSLAEVLRMTGDDDGSLAHYAEALVITPNFITSQYGRGDTYTLMGKYSLARAEYDKAMRMASASDHDRLHIEFQKTLVRFWEGDAATGRTELAALSVRAGQAKDGMAQFEIDYARVLLAADHKEANDVLTSMKARLADAHDLLPAERNQEYASVLREKVRLAVLDKNSDDADALIKEMEELATTSRDQKVESIYESSKGYVSAAKGDYTGAVDGLTSDLHSPLVVEQLLLAEQKLKDVDGKQKAEVRLKYLRTPTAEWLVTKKMVAEDNSHSASN